MERFLRKGYNVPDGYMGFIPEKNKYQLFASEQDYKEQVIFPQIESEDEDEVDN